jgi:hypothetical protein
VRLIEEHRFGEMVCYDPPNIGSIPIVQSIKRLSVVDVNGSAVQAARALGVSFGDSAIFSNPFPHSRVPEGTLAEKYNVSHDGTVAFDDDMD